MSTQLDEPEPDYDFFFDTVAKVMPVRTAERKLLGYVEALISPINLDKTRVSYGYDYLPTKNNFYYVGEKDFETQGHKRKRYTEPSCYVKCYSCNKVCLVYSLCTVCQPYNTFCIDCVNFNHSCLCNHIKELKSRVL